MGELGGLRVFFILHQFLLNYIRLFLIVSYSYISYHILICFIVLHSTRFFSNYAILYPKIISGILFYCIQFCSILLYSLILQSILLCCIITLDLIVIYLLTFYFLVLRSIMLNF